VFFCSRSLGIGWDKKKKTGSLNFLFFIKKWNHKNHSIIFYIILLLKQSSDYSGFFRSIFSLLWFLWFCNPKNQFFKRIRDIYMSRIPRRRLLSNDHLYFSLLWFIAKPNQDSLVIMGIKTSPMHPSFFPIKKKLIYVFQRA
jgi:hypothetical protein